MEQLHLRFDDKYANLPSTKIAVITHEPSKVSTIQPALDWEPAPSHSPSSSPPKPSTASPRSVESAAIPTQGVLNQDNDTLKKITRIKQYQQAKLDMLQRKESVVTPELPITTLPLTKNQKRIAKIHQQHILEDRKWVDKYWTIKPETWTRHAATTVINIFKMPQVAIRPPEEHTPARSQEQLNTTIAALMVSPTPLSTNIKLAEMASIAIKSIQKWKTNDRWDLHYFICAQDESKSHKATVPNIQVLQNWLLFAHRGKKAVDWIIPVVTDIYSKLCKNFLWDNLWKHNPHRQGLNQHLLNGLQ